MISRNIYMAIKDSSQKDSLGNFYPDVILFPINKFNYTEPPIKVVVTQGDIDRFDIFCNYYYGTPNFTDLLLFLNSYGSVHQIQVGDELTLPSSNDINRFYVSAI